MHKFKVKDIMTKNVFVLYANETLDIVRSLMEIKHVRHVPIVDTKGRFVGLITHRDLLSMTVSRLAGIDENVQDDLDRHIPISKVMQRKIITADPDMDVSKAIAILLKNQVGCLPVVSRKKLIGIVTEADFLAFTYSLLKKRKKV
jgi:CBS domain-containing membrane protein